MAVRYERDGNVATLTLDRPERRNAFNRAMKDRLIDCIAKADADDEVRAVIVTGAGNDFCVGADLSGGADALRTDTPGWRDGGGEVALCLFQCRKPVIAAITGSAIGVGVTMTLPMDIRLASEDARCGFVFARRGIVPESCSSWFLPRVVGIVRALEWTLTGRIVAVPEAQAAVLVNEVLPSASLLARARDRGGDRRAMLRCVRRDVAPTPVADARRGAPHGRPSHRERGARRAGACARRRRRDQCVSRQTPGAVPDAAQHGHATGLSLV